MPLELALGLRDEVSGLRATVAHIASDIADMRQELRSDIRRLDERIFQLMLVQLGTIATALASLVAALVS